MGRCDLRQAILSEFEREILRAYLREGSMINPNAFWVLQNRIWKSLETLREDIDLIERFVKRKSASGKVLPYCHRKDYS